MSSSDVLLFSFWSSLDSLSRAYTWSSCGDVWFGVEPKTPSWPRIGSNVGQEVTGPEDKQVKNKTAMRQIQRFVGDEYFVE